VVTDEELIKKIDEFRREEKNARENYFNGLIDFLKWTTTIALASFLWIGANIPHFFTKSVNSTPINQSINDTLPQTFHISNNLLLFVSGTCLFFAFVSITVSLVFAIIILFKVIELKKSDWVNLSFFRDLIELMKSQRNEDLNNEFIDKQMEILKQSLPPSKQYQQFTDIVKWHVLALIVGIMLFYFGILSAV